MYNTNLKQNIKIEVGSPARKQLLRNKKVKIYEKALTKLLNEEITREDCIKIFYLCVKLVVLNKEPNVKERKKYNQQYSNSVDLKESYHRKNYLYGELAFQYGNFVTPKEIMECFPITKDYNGEKYECKDFFNVSKEIEKYPINEMLGDNLIEFLWDYYNSTLCCFLASHLTSFDYALMKENKQGLLETTFEFLGVQIDKYVINERKNVIINTRTKEEFPIVDKNNNSNKFICVEDN